jgi:hypothetical protein
MDSDSDPFQPQQNDASSIFSQYSSQLNENSNVSVQNQASVRYISSFDPFDIPNASTSPTLHSSFTNNSTTEGSTNTFNSGFAATTVFNSAARRGSSSSGSSDDELEVEDLETMDPRLKSMYSPSKQTMLTSEPYGSVLIRVSARSLITKDWKSVVFCFQAVSQESRNNKMSLEIIKRVSKQASG